ncbi:MAG: helix-hairpin-helix domain-containing protein [Bacteroidota bacterium]
MWKNFVKDYLSFTKKDRVGVIVLVTLIFIVVLLPYAWPAKKVKQADPQEIEKIKLLAAELNKANDAPASSSYTKKNEYKPGSYPTTKDYDKDKAVLFYFDPNTLDAAGWERLGVREKTAATIVKYISKGGKFRKPEDISKIYGLFKDEVARLMPYVKIVAQANVEKKYYDDKRIDEKYLNEKKRYFNNDKPAYTSTYPAKKTFPLKQIEINTADTSVLIALPGIGSKLAARIVNFRDKLGGFYSVKQVGETYGLPDSTFSKIQSSLQCNHAAVKQFNINTVDANTLKQHPYIRWNLANAIVQYRAQHGNFKSIEDLQLIAVITPDIFEKVKAYLVVQ